MAKIGLVVSALMGMAGCGALGPSDQEAADVRAALEQLGPPYAVKFVANDGSASEGLTRDLDMALRFGGTEMSAEQLREVLAAVGNALPATFEPDMSLSISYAQPTESRYVDLRPLVEQLGLSDRVRATNYHMRFTRSDLAPLLGEQ